MRRLSEIYEALRAVPPRRVAVAAAEDETVLEAVVSLCRRGIIRVILFGNGRKIAGILEGMGEDPNQYTIQNCPDQETAAHEAVLATAGGEADILMKGFLPSHVFIRAMLDKSTGLPVIGTPLCATALVELEMNGERKVLFLTDPGFIPLPDLAAKKAMIQNTVEKLRLLGYTCPKVAVLSAAEEVNRKIPSSAEARALQEMNERGEIEGCCVCGPISMDLAVSKEAAHHKGFFHPVAGDADLLLVPSLEAGNALLKTMTQLFRTPAAGMVCGTTKPVVFNSRSDTPETKCNTIALAALLAERMGL